MGQGIWRLPVWLAFATYIFGRSESMGMVDSRKCPLIYKSGDKFLYVNSLMSRKRAISRCEANHGKLPMPTETSWKEFLEYIQSKSNFTKNRREGIWIGVTFHKTEKSEILARDIDGLGLSDKLKNKLLEHRQKLNEKKMCMAYFPPIDGRNDWHFKLQACEGAKALVACKCLAAVKKDAKLSNREKAMIPPPTNLEKWYNSSLKPSERPAEKVDESKIMPNNSNKTDSASSTTLVIALMGLLLAACLVAMAYTAAKKKHWNVSESIARQTTYNRSRSNANGDIYHRGQEMSEVSSASHRPTHVYEEIILRDSANVEGNGSAVLSNSSFDNILPLPSPDPPSLHQNLFALSDNTIIKSTENGYLQPSFRKIVTIPGDAKSQTPAGESIFNFPTFESANMQAVPKEKELKYASVETIRTLIEGGSENDEEYFVDDIDKAASNSDKMDELFVQMPAENCRLVGSQSQANSNTFVNSEVREKDGNAISYRTYKNGLFLTAAANNPPVKPKRKSRGSIRAAIDGALYSRIASVSYQPVYAQVKHNNRNKLDMYDATALMPISEDKNQASLLETEKNSTLDSFTQSRVVEGESPIRQQKDNIHIGFQL